MMWPDGFWVKKSKDVLMPESRSLRENMMLYLKGWGMGIADLIPGISGGTMALIFGIYEELIEAIRSVTFVNLKPVLRGRWFESFKLMRLPFLVVLLSGIGSAIVILSRLINWLLIYQPEHLYGFFFGLILATIPLICKEVKVWSMVKGITFGLTAVCAWNIVQQLPIQTPDTFLFIFASGAIAICAMILPGISGSFILLILGKYQTVLQAVHDRDLLFLSIFALGMIVGILSFVRFVSWALSRAHDSVMAVLAGFVLGSLHKIWPWKETLDYTINKHGVSVPLMQKNIFPDCSLPVVFTTILILFGIVLGVFLDKIPKRAPQFHNFMPTESI